jgi:hypothetical protein
MDVMQMRLRYFRCARIYEADTDNLDIVVGDGAFLPTSKSQKPD